jgi:uroporphyrinogen decarboxylase
MFEPLPREEVIKAVERRGPRSVPRVFTRWWGEGLQEQYGDRLTRLNRYKEDAIVTLVGAVDVSKMGLSYLAEPDGKSRGMDAGGAIPDWKHLDEFIANLPGPSVLAMDDSIKAGQRAVSENRYFLWGFWSLFFERPWSLRGMENLMIDYYENPDQVHRLHEALCGLYVGYIRRAARECHPDGFWTSDDLGNQRQLMMKPEHFREFLKPYYRRVATACHENGMHFWLHSCGNNTEILEDLIEVGLDVFHPVQKHTMDEQDVARRFGGRLSFLVGFDVQQTLRTGTPQQVRSEVRYLIDTFDRPEGGMCLAAGNGIVAGTPLENIDAFLDEAQRYGWIHRNPVPK